MVNERDDAETVGEEETAQPEAAKTEESERPDQQPDAPEDVQEQPAPPDAPEEGAAEPPTPVAEQAPPEAEQTAPPEGEPAPPADVEAPTEEAEAPVAATERPPAVDETPDTEAEVPAAEQDTPAPAEDVPAAETPAPADEAPADDKRPKRKKQPARAGAKTNGRAAVEEGDRRDIPTEEDAFQEGRVWYIIHTYSGHENKVKTNLEHRIASMDAQDLIFRVVVPTEDEIEIREGQRRTVSRKIFPGYILVQMVELKEDDPNSNRAWFVVRNTPGVTGFVGSGTRPVPLEQDEVRRILRQMRVEEPRVKVGFAIGESVRIVDGPFQDFVGQVDDLNLEKGKVKVLVSFFGRETPVELDFLQVERL